VPLVNGAMFIVGCKRPKVTAPDKISREAGRGGRMQRRGSATSEKGGVAWEDKHQGRRRKIEKGKKNIIFDDVKKPI